MIELSLRYKGEPILDDPFVCIVSEMGSISKGNQIFKSPNVNGLYEFGEFKIMLEKVDINFDLGEILIFFPKQNRIQRFFRPNTIGNTILLTEQCDQICLMCSQPPKKKDYLHWNLYIQAVSLIPEGEVLGISGGEPTLYKEELLKFLINCLEVNPSLQINVLTNAQHFEESDINTLMKLNQNVLWGVPIYSENPDEHNKIVGKEMAFYKLLEGFNYLLKSGSRVELRTVLLQKNYSSFIKLSKFVARHFTWIEKWAIMQLEPIGYAKIDWSLKFVDTTIDPEILEQAVLTAYSSGIHTELYNFPLCSVPKNLQKFCVKSISDWKQKYLSECNNCFLKKSCCGFFEWYNDHNGYSLIKAIKE